MLRPDQPLALYMEGKLGELQGKMGYGLLRYSPNPIACVIDSAHAGKGVGDVIDTPRRCPVVAGVAEAAALGATVLVPAIAPSGGRMPESWLADLDEAVRRGMCLVNGLHDRLAPRYPDLPDGQWVWDIRQEPAGLGVGKGRARELGNRRVLVVGTDMAQGKMTAALELHRAARARGVRSEFLATGQIGIAIAGKGVPIDAVRVDFACGAVEQAVLAEAGAEVLFIEGQGSLLHPGSTSNLPLLRGACPTHLVLCHRAGWETLRDFPWIRVGDLRRVMTLYEDLGAACGTMPRPVTVGVALNTGHLGPAEAERHVAALREELAMPVTDVIRFGAADLLEAVLTT